MVWDGTTGQRKAVGVIVWQTQADHPLFDLAITVHLSIFHRSSYITRTATVIIIKILQPRETKYLFSSLLQKERAHYWIQKWVLHHSQCEDFETAVVLRMLARS